MLSSLPWLPLLAAFVTALPYDNCTTVATEVIVPSRTATYSTTDVYTVHPTTAENFGTFTYTTTLSSVKTLTTLTSTSTRCHEAPIFFQFETTTVYANDSVHTSSTQSAPWWGLGPRSDGGCTVTSTSTSYYGETYTFVPAGATSTFYDYTAFSQAYTTATTSGGTAYTIATASATRDAVCAGQKTVSPSAFTSTVTLDARCAPTAITSAYLGFGIEYKEDVPLNGAAYITSAEDASLCCQLCAESADCSASSWDIRNGNCTLEFAVSEAGDLECGLGMLALGGQGPDYPLAAGAGLYVAALCGDIEYGLSAPDDGT